MKITLRSKPVANGSRSLFLEYYEKSRRTYEFLRLYLIPEVDEQAKRENENALKKAQAIKAERTFHPDTIPTEESKQKEKARLAKEKDNKVTFMEWMDEYQRMMQDNGTYSIGSFNQTKTVGDAVCQYLASVGKKDVLLSKIDKRFVYGFLQFLGDGYVQKHCRKENKPLSAYTLRTYQTRFNIILNKAVKEGRMIANPFYQLDKSQTHPKCKGKREYLTIDEVQRFMAVKTNGKETQRAFAFACFTGLRISDIRSLKWTDIKNPDTFPPSSWSKPRHRLLSVCRSARWPCRSFRSTRTIATCSIYPPQRQYMPTASA